MKAIMRLCNTVSDQLQHLGSAITKENKCLAETDRMQQGRCSEQKKRIPHLSAEVRKKLLKFLILSILTYCFKSVYLKKNEGNKSNRT